eukprot:3654098-Rhodomonas_salina.2
MLSAYLAPPTPACRKHRVELPASGGADSEAQICKTSEMNLKDTHPPSLYEHPGAIARGDVHEEGCNVRVDRSANTGVLLKYLPSGLLSSPSLAQAAAIRRFGKQQLTWRRTAGQSPPSRAADPTRPR